MNIGEKFFCSSCLVVLCDELICPICGYDPAGIPEPDVLEEGTLLNGIQYQIGAVRSRTKNYIMYGAFNYISRKTIFVKEFFPAGLAARDIFQSEQIIVLKENMAAFENEKRNFILGRE